MSKPAGSSVAQTFSDRKPRNIEGIRYARRSGRILNLADVYSEMAKEDPGAVEAARLFENRMLNRAVYLKHDLREHERHCVPDHCGPVLKIFVPFNPNRFGDGGRSLYYGEPQFENILVQQFGLKAEEVHRRNGRDIRILEILEDLPTLDTFIVKEMFSRSGITVPGLFWKFANNRSNVAEAHIVKSFGPLVRKAVGQVDDATIERVSREILEFRDNEVSRQLAGALRIDYADWPEVTFAWKSALYYEFNLQRIVSQFGALKIISRKIQVTQVYDRKSADAAQALFIEFTGVLEAKLAEFEGLVARFREAFTRDLIEGADLASFRSALLAMKDHAYELGIAYGTLDHVLSYMEYLFPRARPPIITCDRLVSLTENFTELLSS